MTPATIKEQDQPGSVLDGLTGMFNVFIDPAATARSVPSKLSWLWPVLILAAVYTVFGYLLVPYSLQLMESTLAQRNIPAAQMEQTRSIMAITTKVMTPLTSVFVIGFLAFYALLVKVVYSIMDIRPKFRELFSLLAACSLIPAMQYIASYFVIRAKGDPIDTPEQMTPPFGLDIFFPNLHGPALALLGYFSLFQIWFLVVLCIGLAALTKTSKTKAILAMIPVWLFPLLFRVAGSLFSRQS
jgi:hypothetical protein